MSHSIVRQLNHIKKLLSALISSKTQQTSPPNRVPFHLGVFLFIKGLGLCYLIAFASLWSQLNGLYGSNGLLPIHENVAILSKHLPFSALPSLFWINSSDLVLNAACIIGVLSGALLILGLAPKVQLLISWILYLSFVNTGQDFMHFQWDVLLLEIGFIALFLCPFQWKQIKPGPYSGPIRFYLQFTLARLMISSGWVKLASGDLSWRQLNALNVHFETQPLPHWGSFFAHQLPDALLRFSTLIMFIIELIIPFLLFAPRTYRHIAVSLIGLLMILIGLTGNYGFFNLLVIVLALLCLDNRILSPLHKSLINNKPAIVQQNRHRILCGLGIFFSIILELNRFTPFQTPQLIKPMTQTLSQQWHLVHTYGLFANMTQTRFEIDIQGSMDGLTWKSYEFKFKPNALGHFPSWVQPHQPRLDWQLWFAALRPFTPHSWMGRFLMALLEGRPEVLELLKSSPFEQPPIYLRAHLYQYQFQSFSQWQENHQIWKRQFVKVYCPTIRRASNK